MKTPEAKCLKLLGLIYGIVVVGGHLLVITAGEAHTFAIDDVNGWYEFYVVHG